MTSTFVPGMRRAPGIALIVAAGAYALLCAALLASGGTAAMALALALALGPAIVLVALLRPLLLPYALFVATVPFENLLSAPGFGTVSRLLGLASAVALALWIARTRRIVAPGKAALCWAALVLFEVASLLWTSDVSNGALHVTRIAEAVALYLMLAVTPLGRNDLRAIVATFVGGAVAASVYGIWLSRTNPQAIHDAGRLFIGSDSQAIDPNHFANALVAPTLIAVVVALRARGMLRLVAIAAIVALVWGIEVTLSREAFVALATGLLYLAARTRFRVPIAIALVAGIAVLFATPALVDRFVQAGVNGGAGRTSIWAVALAAFAHDGFLGSGAGSFANAYDAAYLGVYQPFVAGWSRAPHDLALQFGVEFGIVGLALVACAWWFQGRTTRAVVGTSAHADLARAIEAATLALLVAACFIDLMETKYLWLVFALAAQCRHVARAIPDTIPRAKPIANPT